MFWTGLIVGLVSGSIVGIVAISLFAGNRDRIESCETCPWWIKLERCRSDCKALEEQLEAARKSRNALQGVVNQQLYMIKALKREKCVEMGNQFFSRNVAR